MLWVIRGLVSLEVLYCCYQGTFDHMTAGIYLSMAGLYFRSTTLNKKDIKKMRSECDV